jgi:DNA topoisomerase I
VAVLHYSKDIDLPWRRVKKGSGFTFVDEKGKRIPTKENDRIAHLAIPPAWKDVTINRDPQNYIQAVGVDAAGRKQYIYHPKWIQKNQEKKFDQMIAFGERLPTLRRAVRAHMRERSLSQDRVIATIIWLLEHTFIRVGNKTYAQENGSYGLTTMREKHVEMDGGTVTFNFKGKSGVQHELDVTQPTIVQTIRECIDLPGYELFQYIDEDNNKRHVDAADVNDYLQSHIGSDFSAKDFRTWGGTVLAGDSLYKKGNPTCKEDGEDKITEAITEVSKHLGNTKKVCRTYYIHPVIINSYEKNILVPHFERSYKRKLSKPLSLSHEEYATWSLIKDS